jgi:hypothetical protein
MDYILGGIRFKTRQIPKNSEKILVEMIKDKQVVDTFKLSSNLTSLETIQQISFVVLSSYPALSNTTGFSIKS